MSRPAIHTPLPASHPSSPRAPSRTTRPARPAWAPLLALCMLGAPQLARAGAPPAADGAASPPPTRAVVIDEDDEVEGELPRPSGDRVGARVPGRHGSLIRLRVRFNDRLVAISADMTPG